MSESQAPLYVDPHSRFRWVPPLMAGLALGGAVGCLVTFAVTVLGQRARANELVAERFDISQVVAARGTGEVAVTKDNTVYLGHAGRQGETTVSAVRREIRLRGAIPKGADPSAFAQQLKALIDAELSRQGALPTGSSSPPSDGNEARQTAGTSYSTRDGRSGFLDLDLVVRDGRVEGVLIITEAR